MNQFKENGKCVSEACTSTSELINDREFWELSRKKESIYMHSVRVWLVVKQ